MVALGRKQGCRNYTELSKEHAAFASSRNFVMLLSQGLHVSASLAILRLSNQRVVIYPQMLFLDRSL